MKIKAHYTALCFTDISNKEKRQTLSVIQNTPRDVLLKKMGKVDSDLCTFCNLIKEDREHLFFYCPFPLSFWGDSGVYWSININETGNISTGARYNCGH